MEFLYIIITITLLIIQNLIMNIRISNKTYYSWERGYNEGFHDGFNCSPHKEDTMWEKDE